ncbi:DUF1345 domain-containing protein [Microbacterium sp. H1-D42]|uniref:DUF1345 domain-containing protein n=1 Tax=Microbacterium sp. H1-D42 TaxID=2925844 RepID=UPI001F5358D6|nr:DUF1345 domain-containing protein [Microbacterium sp. H1-D42]UNK69830.1 DUF1345 domain-containing protein [Microbacterium sp. H1-D42]
MAETADRAHVRLRLGCAILLGIAAGVGMGAVFGPAVGVVGGWGALALVNAIWVLLVVWPMDADATRTHALAEDPGRRTARLIAIIGSLVSLVAVGVVVLQARNAPELEGNLLAAITVLGVAASWALIQVDYMLRYARIYYSEPIGGISFNQREDPQYSDFAYFSVGLGMTYQVADTNVSTSEIRRIVVAQTLLAYLFGAVILATVINLVTSLGG